MTLVDTVVLLDIVTADKVWMSWSEQELRNAASRGPLLINPIIYAELAPAFETEAKLDDWLAKGPLIRSPLPYAAGWLASCAFVKYRNLGGTKTSSLPDFYTGAHAEVQNLTLLTRDVRRYQTYFPKVKLICPP